MGNQVPSVVTSGAPVNLRIGNAPRLCVMRAAYALLRRRPLGATCRQCIFFLLALSLSIAGKCCAVRRRCDCKPVLWVTVPCASCFAPPCLNTGCEIMKVGLTTNGLRDACDLLSTSRDCFLFECTSPEKCGGDWRFLRPVNTKATYCGPQMLTLNKNTLPCLWKKKTPLALAY